MTVANNFDPDEDSQKVRQYQKFKLVDTNIIYQQTLNENEL